MPIYDGNTENIQKALDLTLQSLQETTAGAPVGNHIIALKLINRKGCVDMSGRKKADGKYVRVVWSNDPERNDGYYDINVDCCSGFGVLTTVWNWLSSKL